MSLTAKVGDLAARISATLRDSYKPRLLPAGGVFGQLLAKRTADPYDTTWVDPPSGGSTSTAATDLFWFGDGSDGDLSVSSGTTTLVRDTYYRNLTLSGSAVLDPAGFRVHVSGILDISNLTTGYVSRTVNPGNNGTATTGGATPSQHSAASLGTNGGGVAGGAGSISGTGGFAAASSTGAWAGGDNFGTPRSGAGGRGSSYFGGAAGFASVGSAPTRIRRPTIDVIRGSSVINGGRGSIAGAGGGGDGTNQGGGGGSSGYPGSVIAVFARTINRSASTTPGAIRCMGTKAGDGFSPTAGNTGGGGGGLGGPGGFITIVYRFLTGATATGAIDVSGGDGGTGGLGSGTGTAGGGGGAGWGGYTTLFDIQAGTCAAYLGPQSNVNPTGRIGETAAVARTDL